MVRSRKNAQGPGRGRDGEGIDMSGRWVVITGCSGGIGHYCAVHLKTRGWDVIATARKADDLERLETQGFAAVRLDYADPASIESATAEVARLTGGRLSGLVNNGAYAQLGALEDLDAQALRAQFEANVIGWHDFTRRLIPLMRANGAGRIVQMSSFLGLVTLRWRGAYAASKFALEGWTDTLRLELRGSGIHVCLVEPGPIESGFSDSSIAHFQQRVDAGASHYSEAYEPLYRRFEKGHASPLTKGPDAVFARIRHALESRRPRARYHVTLATPIFATLRWCLPRPLLDRFLYWASDK